MDIAALLSSSLDPVKLTDTVTVNRRGPVNQSLLFIKKSRGVNLFVIARLRSEKNRIPNSVLYFPSADQRINKGSRYLNHSLSQRDSSLKLKEGQKEMRPLLAFS